MLSPKIGFWILIRFLDFGGAGGGFSFVGWVEGSRFNIHISEIYPVTHHSYKSPPRQSGAAKNRPHPTSKSRRGFPKLSKFSKATGRHKRLPVRILSFPTARQLCAFGLVGQGDGLHAFNSNADRVLFALFVQFVTPFGFGLFRCAVHRK
jgi:hypothetical protein